MRELLEPVFFGKLLDFNMLGGFLSFDFELVDVGGFFFDLGTEGFGFPHMMFDGAGGEAFPEGEVAEFYLAAGKLGRPLSDFPVELAPSGVYPSAGRIYRRA